MKQHARLIWRLYLLGELRRADGSVVTNVIEAHQMATRKPAAQG